MKAIFFDIDGTLLSSSGRVLASTKKAIQQAQKNGVLVGVATARDPQKVHQLLKNLPLDMYITYNGQYVYTKQQIIYANSFSKEALAQIIHYADGHSRSVNFGTSQQVLGSKLMKLGQSVLAQRLVRFIPPNFPVGLTKNLLKKIHFFRSKEYYDKLPLKEEAIYQCMMFSPQIEDQQLATALSECDVLRSNHFSVDIVPKGGSKWRGIEIFLASQNISAADAMAFGDYQNDIEMLQKVGVGVAMGNSLAQTKGAADYVTDTNNHDGIAQALAYYQVI